MKRILGIVFTGLLLAAPGWAQTGTAEKELLNLERQWKEAVVKRDVPALQHQGTKRSPSEPMPTVSPVAAKVRVTSGEP